MSCGLPSHTWSLSTHAYRSTFPNGASVSIDLWASGDHSFCSTGLSSEGRLWEGDRVRAVGRARMSGGSRGAWSPAVPGSLLAECRGSQNKSCAGLETRDTDTTCWRAPRHWSNTRTKGRQSHMLTGHPLSSRTLPMPMQPPETHSQPSPGAHHLVPTQEPHAHTHHLTSTQAHVLTHHPKGPRPPPR